MLKSGDSQQDRQLFLKNMKIDTAIKLKFAQNLLKWNREKNTRNMPWKGEKDPYKIWLSEVILQQTRVEQGLAYYNKFINTFPNIKQLAEAPDSKVYKLWEGLGYYTRCKNLLESARIISEKMQGKFPDTYEEILKLKGVGPYTAAAIASFAYNFPNAVVDGNVFRVLARIFGISKAIDSPEGKRYFSALAQELLDKKKAGIYNQAIMDFGAVVCKQVNPLCHQCLFKKYCKAFTRKKIDQLPVKEKRLKIKTRWFYYLVMEYRNKVFIQQRTGNDIWKNLYEFVLIETGKETTTKVILKKAEKAGLLKKKAYKIEFLSPILIQKLSHQRIQGRFIKLKLIRRTALTDLVQVSKNGLKSFAFPKFINSYLQNHGL